MAFRIEAKVEGLGPFLKKLSELRDSLQKRILRSAMRRAASMVNKSAKAASPQDQGWLRMSLGVAVKVYPGGVVIGVVEPRSGFVRKRGQSKKSLSSFGKKLTTQNRRPQNYAHLVERGARAHFIGKGSNVGKGVRKGTMHPGAKPKPFLGPAFRSNQGRIVDLFGEELDKALAKL